MKNEMSDDVLDEALRKRIAMLPREVRPKHDLWFGIEARIAPRHRFLRYWPAAAAVAVVVLAGAIFFATQFSRPVAHAPALAARIAPQRVLSQPALDVMPRTPRAIAIAASVRRSTRLDPKTQAVLLKNLAIIENSLDNIQRALRQDPGNPGLQQLLYQMYRNEAALLDAAQRVQLQTATGVQV